MSWDPFQRAALAELGIEVYVSAYVEADDALRRHLLKAVGGDSREQAMRALAEPLSGLRGNAAAKRALWPLLRRLRRS